MGQCSNDDYELGYASVYLKSIGTTEGGASESGFETGFLIFEEMMTGECGDLSESCTGVCITGNFWGLDFLVGYAETQRF